MNGPFSHIFSGVKWTANFTLNYDERRVKVKNVIPTLTFEKCELFAENFYSHGMPVMDWMAFSKQFKERYETVYAREKGVVLEETTTWVLEVP